MTGEPPPPALVSPDGRFYWDGARWAPIQASVAPEAPASAEQSPLSRSTGIVVLVLYAVAGGLTLFLTLFAFALGGNTGPTTTDLVVLASWVGLALALVAGCVGFALRKRWWYWIGTFGVLAPSAVYPWSLLHDATAYNSAFLASLFVALIAVGFRHSWVRFLAIPAIIFMAITCFEFPAALALAAALLFGVTREQTTGVLRGVIEATADPRIASGL